LKAQSNGKAGPGTILGSSMQNNKSGDSSFPKLKKITLSRKTPIYLSLHGQFREYYQYYKNENFGKLPQSYVDDNGFFWHRFMLSSGLQFGNRVTFFAELKSGLTSNRAGGNRPRIEYNELDIHQLWLEVTFWQVRDADLKVKFGRQEYFSGAQRLFTEREGPNNKATFNAAKISFHKKNFLLTALVAQPVYDNFYVFDDTRIKSQIVWGVNLTHQLKENSGKWELYYYGYHNSNIRLAGINGIDDRHTFAISAYC
jgi:hypothetical protein